MKKRSREKNEDFQVPSSKLGGSKIKRKTKARIRSESHRPQSFSIWNFYVLIEFFFEAGGDGDGAGGGRGDWLRNAAAAAKAAASTYTCDARGMRDAAAYAVTFYRTLCQGMDF